MVQEFIFHIFLYHINLVIFKFIPKIIFIIQDVPYKNFF